MAQPVVPPAPTAAGTRRPRPAALLRLVRARAVVGVAHVAAGALVAGTSPVWLAATAARRGPGDLGVAAAMVVYGGALAAAGRWLRQGRLRGAVLAIVLDGLRLLDLLLGVPWSGVPDLALAALLVGGTLWAWPASARKVSVAPRRA